MEATRARTFFALFSGAILFVATDNAAAANAEARADFAWLSAFAFAPGSDIDTSDGRSTLVAGAVDGEDTLFDSVLAWSPLSLARLSALSAADSAVTGDTSTVSAKTDDGDALAYSSITGLLSYTGLIAKSVVIKIPYSLFALSNVGGATASAEFRAELTREGQATPVASASDLLAAEIISVPNEKSGMLELNFTFEPDQQLLLSLSAFSDAFSPPQVPVPLPLPALLLATAVLSLVGARRA